MVNANATGFVFISFIIFELYTGAIPSVELKPPKIFLETITLLAYPWSQYNTK